MMLLVQLEEMKFNKWSVTLDLKRYSPWEQEKLKKALVEIVHQEIPGNSGAGGAGGGCCMISTLLQCRNR